jgi:putative hemolysin
MYPVCEGSIDQIKGVVSLKDLFIADGEQLVRDIAKEAKYVPENNSAYQVLESFKQSKIHHCFIVNEYGSIEGLITLNDILEAIVGDIPQEEDHDYEVLKRADGTYLIDAQLPFYDFLSYFDKTEFMLQGDQEFDTLAGFIIHSLEKIPTTGETLVWKIFTFEIVDMDQHRIDKILVTLSEED